MRVDVREVLVLAWGAGTLAGLAYTAFAITRVRAFRRRASRFDGGDGPPVTVLKPLHGTESGLFENLSSFCDQDYTAYQIIFTAAMPNDPALEVARAVAQRFPDRDIEIVAGESESAGNPKIRNVLGGIHRARHSLIVIADSDIHVDRTYLQAVASCFRDPAVGAATCIYGGVPTNSLAARLGAMQVNDHFAPSVMVAGALEPLTYCFGATMAVRRSILRQFGGLERLASHLADDYLLGKLVTQCGYRVALVPQPVRTTVTDVTLQALWRHEQRWARTIFGRRPVGYAGSVVTYVLPFAALFALSARSLFSAAVLSAAVMLRTWLHAEARAAFAPQTAPTPWLIPVRDLLSAVIWGSGFFGRRVRWKTADYRLDPGGRMAAGTKEV